MLERYDSFPHGTYSLLWEDSPYHEEQVCVA